LVLTCKFNNFIGAKVGFLTINDIIMDIIELRAYCISKKEVEECFPFDETTLVFKVLGKIFALLSLDEPVYPSINLKCDPELAIDLRERYSCVIPGYHMNKKLWNTIILDGSVDSKTIKLWVDHSYDEVVKKLPKKIQEKLNGNIL
jgi:predicted DNA-binding protein (MmcQ/YjbR family)